MSVKLHAIGDDGKCLCRFIPTAVLVPNDDVTCSHCLAKLAPPPRFEGADEPLLWVHEVEREWSELQQQIPTSWNARVEASTNVHGREPWRVQLRFMSTNMPPQLEDWAEWEGGGRVRGVAVGATLFDALRAARARLSTVAASVTS